MRWLVRRATRLARTLAGMFAGVLLVAASGQAAILFMVRRPLETPTSRASSA